MRSQRKRASGTAREGTALSKASSKAAFVNSQSDEYREKAEYCEAMARGGKTLAQRASWLELASHWRDLIAKYPPVQTETSATETEPPRTPASNEAGTSRTTAPWYADDFFSEMSACEHFVQLHDSDDLLLDTLARFVAGGLASGNAAVVIVTPDHQSTLIHRLTESGADVAALRHSGQLISLDAQETLNRFLVDAWPDDCRFADALAEPLNMARGSSGRKVRVFSEMSALLWGTGCHFATIRLEKLWHETCRQQELSLFCAYPRDGFPKGSSEAMSQVLATHSKVLVR